MIRSAFHFYGESSCSGEKSNKIVLSTAIFGKNGIPLEVFLFSHFYQNAQNITVPYIFFSLLTCSSMKCMAVSVENGMVLSTGQFISLCLLKHCTDPFARKFSLVFRAANNSRSSDIA